LVNISLGFCAYLCYNRYSCKKQLPLIHYDFLIGVEVEIMYQENDLIFYGTIGICKIRSVCCPDNISGTQKGQLYYVLNPVHRDGTTYAPVNTKVFNRPLISSKEARELIDIIPTIEINTDNGNFKALEDSYKAALQTHKCIDLIRIIKTVSAKNKIAVSKGKKLSQIDMRYMKKAEELLYDEFAAVLDIPKEQIRHNIESKIDV